MQVGKQNKTKTRNTVMWILVHWCFKFQETGLESDTSRPASKDRHFLYKRRKTSEILHIWRIACWVSYSSKRLGTAQSGWGSGTVETEWQRFCTTKRCCGIYSARNTPTETWYASGSVSKKNPPKNFEKAFFWWILNDTWHNLENMQSISNQFLDMDMIFTKK